MALPCFYFVGGEDDNREERGVEDAQKRKVAWKFQLGYSMLWYQAVQKRSLRKLYVDIGGDICSDEVDIAGGLSKRWM